MSFLYGNHSAVKQLKKTMKDRGMDDPEAEAFLEKAIKHLSKKCMKDKMLDNLSVAVTAKDKKTPCVLVKRTNEQKRAFALDRGNTHLLACRVFRFGWLSSVNDIKSIPNCPHPYNKKAETFCINPYHYEPPRAKVAGVKVQKDRFPYPLGGLRDVPDDDYIPNHTLSPDNPAFVIRTENNDDDEEMEAPDSNFSEDVDMEVEAVQSTEPTEDPKRPGIFTVPFEETSCWMKICYGECECIMKQVEAHGHQYSIESSAHPHDLDRLCVGYITAQSGVVREKWLEQVRQQMGKGVRMYHHGGEVFIECLSKFPIFVQCPAANRRYGMPLSSVVRVDPKTILKILSYAEFASDLTQAVEHGYEQVNALTKLCSLRVSFVKGWGESYKRKNINQTGCWFIASFPAPMIWIGRIIEKMGAPKLELGSYS